MGTEENILESRFDVFLGYHGTNDPNGSQAVAERLYDILSFENKVKVFLQTKTNVVGDFKGTPIIASHSTVFLLVANNTIPVNSLGRVPEGKDIAEEMKRFYYEKVYGKGTNPAKVFACGGLDYDKAKKLHVMFEGTELFRVAEESEEGFEKAVVSFLRWLTKVLGKEAGYFDETIAHFFGAGDGRCAEESSSSAKPFGREEAVKRALEYSVREFSHQHAADRLESSPEEIRKDIDEFSRIFKDITQIESKGDPKRKNVENIGKTIYDIIIVGSLRGSTPKANKLILKIESPLGSYKNRLLQYVYLYLAKTLTDVLPFYIDVAMYERTDSARWPDTSIKERVRRNLDEIEGMIKASPELIPFVMVDGIRDFACGKVAIYDILKERLDRLGCYWVVGLDTDFTNNSKHEAHYRIAVNDFEYFMRISSMKLDRKEESKEFMKTCIEIFQKEDRNLGHYSEEDVDRLYEKFNKFELISLDAYWFITILRNLQSYSPENLIELYTSLCKDVLGSETEKTDKAADFAYNFEFGEESFEDSEFFFSKEWKTVRKHRSVLDFLVARSYMNQLETLNMDDLEKCNNENDETGIRDMLKPFDIVMPKSITRFVVAMLRQSDEMQKKVLEIATKYYNGLGLYGKSEFTLWLGRMTERYSRSAQDILEGLRCEQLRLCANCACEDMNERRNKAFLLRGISVSRIYGGNAQAFTDYMHSLLRDKLANEINRGFHLEYYGDIKVSVRPGKYVLQYEDNTSKGINTFRALEMSLSDLEKEGKTYTYKAVLQLFTMCSLIQARMFGGEKVLDVSAMISRCLAHIGVLLSQKSFFNRLDGEIKAYFQWIGGEFKSFKKRSEAAVETSVYDKFSRACGVERTGWINRGLAHPENIVEHMYACWLMGLVFLPDQSEEEGYCKDSVLKMLLIHDIGEVGTGDIDRGTKKTNRDVYDKREDAEVRSLLFIGTYPEVKASLADFSDQWTRWMKHNEEDADINALIAKDIDDIQAAYQYCKYYLEGKGAFTEDDCVRWLSEVYVGGQYCALRTGIGCEISKKAIIENPEFAKCIRLVKDFQA